MKNIILQHNMFLQNMAIVPNINIKDDDREQVKNYSHPHYLSSDLKLQESHPKACIY